MSPVTVKEEKERGGSVRSIMAMATTLQHPKIVEFRLAQPYSEDLKIAVLRLAQLISESTEVRLRKSIWVSFCIYTARSAYSRNTSNNFTASPHTF